MHVSIYICAFLPIKDIFESKKNDNSLILYYLMSCLLHCCPVLSRLEQFPLA